MVLWVDRVEYQRFGGPRCLHEDGSVITLEDHDMNLHRRENLKSRTRMFSDDDRLHLTSPTSNV